MISPSALRGFVLEELIAKLLQASGFDLLVEPAQDPNALALAGNGLQIHGRGADHQVDVLGQLHLEIPFSYPIRLFVEAKYRSKPTGLDAVRARARLLSPGRFGLGWSGCGDPPPQGLSPLFVRSAAI